MLAGALSVLSGCATQNPETVPGPAVELDQVPFFPQERYQCGPAALATVLADSGVGVTPDELVPLVYVPERRGSFALELKSATRVYGRLPHELEPRLPAILEELQLGRPVLVLQNLGFDWLPTWHYAVIVGLEPESNTFILRSGTQRRQRMSARRFLRSWNEESSWAMVALRPGDLPASGSAAAYLRIVVDAEAFLTPEQIAVAYTAGLQRWPDDATLAFAAANHARVRGFPVEASALYRRALAAEPTHLGALNNYADLLVDEGCFAGATRQLDTAWQVAGPKSPLQPVLVATERELESAMAVAGRTDEGPRCARLIPEGQ